MIGTPEQDAFISRSGNAIVTTLRRDGSPSSSLVSFARVGDHLWVSTTDNRVKGRSLARDPRLALCVINAKEPNSYVTVEGRAVLHLDNPLAMQEAMMDAWEEASLMPLVMTRHDVLAMWRHPARLLVELAPVRVSGVFL